MSVIRRSYGRINLLSISFPFAGVFVPNPVTPYGNANKHLDILRCKMNNGEKAYMELARSKEEMTVEIIKENIVGIIVRGQTIWHEHSCRRKRDGE